MDEGCGEGADCCYAVEVVDGDAVVGDGVIRRFFFG